MSISRRIGNCLLILLVVYLGVTVYFTSTMLSQAKGTGEADYGSLGADDQSDVSNLRANIINKEKLQLFHIENSEFRQHKDTRTSNTSTMKPVNNWMKNLNPPEVKMDGPVSKRKDENVQVMLEEWKKKMEKLRNNQLKNANSKLMQLKQALVNLPGASKTKNVDKSNKYNEKARKTINNKSEVVDRRVKSVNTYKSLPTYHTNMQSIPGEEITVYSAYFDGRKQTKFIRIVLIATRVKPRYSMVCKFFLADRSNNTVTSLVNLYETCESHNKFFSSFIGSCEVPNDDVILDQVGLSMEESDKDVYMNVIDNSRNNPVEMQTLAICVPPLFGDVSVVRLTEFIELSRLLGAQHFVFYPKFVSSEISLLLDYYRSIGMVTVMAWNLTIPLNDIWYHGQSASVWDCLYRTMFKFRHVAFIDFDEFIIPKMQSTIPEFLTFLQQEEGINDEIMSAYKFQSAFFDPKFVSDDKPKPLEMQELATMNVTQRTKRLSKIRTKLIVNPINVFEIGIHHVSKPNEEHYQCLDINPKLAFIHHYRECRSDYGMNCKLTTTDTSILRYNDTLIYRVKLSLAEASLQKPRD